MTDTASVRADIKRMIREVFRYQLQTMTKEEKDQYIYDRMYDELLRVGNRKELEELYQAALLWHEAHGGAGSIDRGK